MSKIEVNEIDKTTGSTLTLGGSGTAVTLACGATQTGFGREGSVNWQTTPKTGDFTAVNGQGYFVDTTSATITMTMPSGSAGAIVSIQDYNKTFDNNNFIIAPASGEKINGGTASANLVINTEGQGLTFVYVDSTVGWKTVHENEFTAGGTNFIVATGGTETTCGNCKIHTFTGPGTFAVCRIATVCAPANNEVSYLVVAGGGGGGKSHGGGGGAGGFRESKSPVTPYTASPLDGRPSAPNRITVTATSFPITVGGGGTGSPSSPTPATSGSNSIFSTITSAGGGLGATNTPGCESGGNGGSGGGSTWKSPSGPGSGNTPPTTPAQGSNGGGPGNPSYRGAGGGGGATAVGTKNSSNQGGDGGAGATTGVSGSNTAYAGGGGAGGGVCSSYGSPTGPLGGAGGTGGGGSTYQGGTNPQPSPGSDMSGGNGTTNTGGGGGGSFAGDTKACVGGNGGSGVVIIRYKYQ
jgi:hypothetical protein